ncbi:MAG: YicC family protein [Phycisphaerae bacterium]|nr:YicC family protein [Phycisphaerae bacterium]|tara:strand:+ start:844 stop:1713 length:870 start_codon:yes stop_codon:yes gene_type:complete
MTGFGSATETVDGCRFVIEARAVNGRYLKCHIRLPEEFQGLEQGLEEIVSSSLDRGTVTVTVRVSGSSLDSGAAVDPAVLDRYIEQLKPVSEKHDLSIQIADMLELPGVLVAQVDDDARSRVVEIMHRLLKQACDELDGMRCREGETLQQDLQGSLDEIRTALDFIRERSPVVVNLYEDRLRQRMESLMSSVGATVADEDLVREVAIFAERSDIAEEVIRLSGHLDHFQELMNSDTGEPLGRTLDFLSQEMLRETNTIGSKCLDSEVSRRTVLIKGAIDRLKEQVQNVR